jgi:hypothetical protein
MAPSSLAKGDALRAVLDASWEAGAKAAAEPIRARKAAVFIMVTVCIEIDWMTKSRNRKVQARQTRRGRRRKQKRQEQLLALP